MADYPTILRALADMLEVKNGHVDTDRFVGVAEISHRLDVSRQTVSNWRARYADFPEPLIELAMGPIWDWADVEAWTATHRMTA